MNSIRHIHPFPARMASDIALKELSKLPNDTIVLDPMMGSGTVIRAATDCGLRAIGRDVDPLAVLMARVWTTPINTKRLCERAVQLVQNASCLHFEDIILPWIDDDPDTSTFIDYFF